MMDKFKVGDLVQMAGIPGPTMVVSVVGAAACNCVWFDRESKINIIEFQTVLLQPAKPPGQVMQ